MKIGRYVAAGIFGVCLLHVADAQTRIPVWIDTDPSIEPGGHEVDDGFALIQAFHSPELAIRGVSVVFGNAPLEKTWPIGQDIVSRFGPKGLGVFKGAGNSAELGKDSAASEALARALTKERLTVIAIGPVTNVATVLKRHPELASRIERIVAVAGRRPGQHFVSGPAQKQPFQDLNFELDPTAFQVLLDSGVPIVLAPWEISSKVWIKAEDLNRLAKGPDDAKFLVHPGRDWLVWWRKNLGTEGFNPFDTLAVGYITSPKLFQCIESNVQIKNADDDVSSDVAARTKPYLLVSPELKTSLRVTYCSNSRPQFKKELVRRLLRKSRRPRP